jgi:hypothetical protein
LDVTQSGGGPCAFVATQPAGSAGGVTPSKFWPKAISRDVPGGQVELGAAAARISTRPQPYTLFGGPAVPHWVEEIKCAALFIVVRLPLMSWRKFGRAHHSNVMAPAICGVAIDVPLRLT